MARRLVDKALAWLFRVVDRWPLDPGEAHPDVARMDERANRDGAVDHARPHSHPDVSDVCQLPDDG